VLVQSRVKEILKYMTLLEKQARWVCLECHYIYDPAKGDPKNGIPPGTPYEMIPDAWHCPECRVLKVKKGVFKRLDD
jgi:rubredoxin